MSNIIETIKYRGYDIDIYCDTTAVNPFTDWDCMPGVFMFWSRDWMRYDMDIWGNAEIPTLTVEQCAANLDWLPDEYSRDFAGIIEFVTGSYMYEYNVTADGVPEAIAEHLDSLSGPEWLEYAETICDIAGVEHASVSGRDCEALIVGEGAESSAGLLSDYLEGDVYSYAIKSIDDSCAGFYGYDHEKSGLLEYARDAIDCDIESGRFIGRALATLAEPAKACAHARGQS